MLYFAMAAAIQTYKQEKKEHNTEHSDDKLRRDISV